jgi:hypothetical protein
MDEIRKQMVLEFVGKMGLVGPIEFKVSADVFNGFDTIGPDKIYIQYPEGEITIIRRPTTEQRLAAIESEIWRRICPPTTRP